MFQVVVEKACERKKKVFGGGMNDNEARVSMTHMVYVQEGKMIGVVKLEDVEEFSRLLLQGFPVEHLLIRSAK